MIPHPQASSPYPGSTMDINTVRGYDLTEYLPVFLHYQLSNLSINWAYFYEKRVWILEGLIEI